MTTAASKIAGKIKRLFMKADFSIPGRAESVPGVRLLL
jgi:hypothetical protein